MDNGSLQIGGQLQNRKWTVQLLAPGCNFSGKALLRKHFPLPGGKISVVDVQVRELVFAGTGERLVVLVQLAQHQPERNTVSDDVMKIDEQHVLVFSDFEQADTKQRKPGQIEWDTSLVRREPMEARHTLIGPHLIQARDGDFYFAFLMNHLPEFATVHREARSQHFVTS